MAVITISKEFGTNSEKAVDLICDNLKHKAR